MKRSTWPTWIGTPVSAAAVTRRSASGRRRREGLLDERRDPAPDRRKPQAEVGRRWRGDDDGIEGVLGQHFLRLDVAPGLGGRASRLEDFGERIRDGHELDILTGAQQLQVIATHRPESDQPDSRRALADRLPAAHRSAVAACRRTTARTASMTRPGRRRRGREHRQGQVMAARSVTGRSARMPSSSTYGWRWTGIG